MQCIHINLNNRKGKQANITTLKKHQIITYNVWDLLSYTLKKEHFTQCAL